MTISLVIILIVILCTSILVIGITTKKRKSITCMTGMMIAMGLGMSAGLILGLVIGIQYSGNLFLSTTLAILIGAAIGFIAGIPVSLMAVLDGLLSGLMGGMMGAMLGEMMATEYRDSMIKIMFIIYITIILILLRLLQQESRKLFSGIFNHPLSLLLFFGIIFITFEQLGSTVLVTEDSGRQNHQPLSNSHNNYIVVKADEYSFFPERFKINKGQTVILEFKNLGKQNHSIKFVGVHATVNIPKSIDHSQEDINHQVHIYTKSGEESKLSFTPLETGTFEVVCTIPGHKESGMRGFLEVF